MKRILTLITAIAMNLGVMAQLSYTDGLFHLSKDCNYFRQTPGFYVDGYNGLILHSAGSWLKIDLTKEYTAISGSMDFINLYDADTGTYGTLFVQEIYNMNDYGNIPYSLTDDSELNVGSKIRALRPVSYRWKPTAEAESTDNLRLRSGEHYGFIAQEIAEIYPELVAYDDYGNMMVNYIGLIPILIQSLKETEERVDRQTLEIEALLSEKTLLEKENVTNKLSQP